MANFTEKQQLKDELLAALEGALRAARAAHQSAVEGATHGEARQENDKDTRGLEQSYVARGQALRIEALEREMAEVQSMPTKRLGESAFVSSGALVTVEFDEMTRRYFIAPHGGGVALSGEVQVLTPRSPMGQALIGKRVDDECEVVLQGARRLVMVVSVE